MKSTAVVEAAMRIVEETRSLKRELRITKDVQLWVLEPTEAVSSAVLNFDEAIKKMAGISEIIFLQGKN